MHSSRAKSCRRPYTYSNTNSPDFDSSNAIFKANSALFVDEILWAFDVKNYAGARASPIESRFKVDMYAPCSCVSVQSVWIVRIPHRYLRTIVVSKTTRL